MKGQASGMRFWVWVIGVGLFLSATPILSAETPATHTVAWGETLYSIARAYAVSPQALASANNIGVNSWVFVGARLTIPDRGDQPAAPILVSTTPSGYYTVRAGDTLFSIAARFNTTVAAISAANRLPPNGVLYVGWSLKIPAADAQPAHDSTPQFATTTHIVQPGEYPAAIALRYGTTTQAIAFANNLPADWFIIPGQRLRVPVAQSKTETPATTAAASVRAANVPLRQQKQTLTCEEASAVMAARGAFTEDQLLAVMPRSDNPFAGIRGRTNSAYLGGLTDYGVYASGLQKGLTALGVQSEILYGQSYADFKNAVWAHLRAGRPVVWWHTWQDSYQKPVPVKMADGATVKLVPYEHASVIVAADERGITYHDPYDATIRFATWETFRRVSAYFDNMALSIMTNDK